MSTVSMLTHCAKCGNPCVAPATDKDAVCAFCYPEVIAAHEAMLERRAARTNPAPEWADFADANVAAYGGKFIRDNYDGSADIVHVHNLADMEGPEGAVHVERGLQGMWYGSMRGNVDRLRSALNSCGWGDLGIHNGRVSRRLVAWDALDGWDGSDAEQDGPIVVYDAEEFVASGDKKMRRWGDPEDHVYVDGEDGLRDYLERRYGISKRSK